MAVLDGINGKYVKLKCADQSDAEFTLGIRNNSELSRFIPRLSLGLEEQIDWINRIREAAFDVFFVIKRHDDQSIGTLSFYDFSQAGRCCEVGRFVSEGNSFENIESIVLILDVLFSKKEISGVVLNIHEDNKPVISLWERFGAEYKKNKRMNDWESVQYYLGKEAYFERLMRIKQLLY